MHIADRSEVDSDAQWGQSSPLHNVWPQGPVERLAERLVGRWRLWRRDEFIERTVGTKGYRGAKAVGASNHSKLSGPTNPGAY